ncbi:MAG: hypothetical protein OEV93_04705 [Candidatus Moranbacteria bacterium]|nr:hypothetical protein [Candidatus Moranbacteria bacterium]
MKIQVKNIKENPVSLLRRAGYTFQHHTDRDEMSFVRPLARAGFPRFHMYAKMEERDLMISIHLDQKKETYGKDTRHHGEYENDGALMEEVQRIARVIG